MRVLFVIFIIVPIIEMWLLIEVGSVIGALNTIGLVFVTAIVGAALLRQQGLDTLLRVNQRIESGQLPATEIIEGVILAVGGALLITPGFATDLIGFACLLPWSRRWFSRALIKRGAVNMMSSGGTGGFGPQRRADFQSERGPRAVFEEKSTGRDNQQGSTTIEGEFKRED